MAYHYPALVAGRKPIIKMLFYSKQTAVVLLLHRVLPQRDTMWDPMDPALFEQVLQYVQRRFNTIPLEELLFDKPATGTKPFAAITFDDGYSDFISHSIPLLKKYNLPASMFVTTECIDKNIPTWTYVLDYLFENTKQLALKDFDATGLPEKFAVAKWQSNKDRIVYGKIIKQQLKWVPASVRNKTIDTVITSFDDVQLPNGMMMTWEDVKQINTAGYTVGSHSVSHPTLATIENDEELDYELQHAATQLKEKAGISSSVFSYPCGSYDSRVEEHTRKAGYKAGLAVDRQLYQPKQDGIFAVPRIELYNEHWQKSKMRMNGTISFIEKIIKK
jgi:peptidoglycan/xylan/chitin deacetylase (PgdA/CDA1 family)